MVCLGNICINTLHKGAKDDDDDDDDDDDNNNNNNKSANVKVLNIFQGRNNITCSTNCKYRTAATLYTVETWFVSGT
jgi:hypothetical protein